MNETPLIWTIRGNVPESSLRYEKRWLDDGKVLWLHEEWRFEDGELAKNNAHGYGYGLQAGSEAVLEALQ